MKPMFRATALLSLGWAVAAGLGHPSRSLAAACDRACLDGFIDGYLASMAAHDPARVPLSGAIRATENTIVMPPGQGLWATLSDVGSYRLHFADPEAGQAGFMGTIRENGAPAILALRLKVVDGRIAEAEAVVHRNAADAAELEKRGQPDPLWSEPLSADDRPSRQELVATTDLYFQGILRLDGDIVPFDKDCNRILDGTQDTNNPADTSFMFGAFNPSALNCRDNMNTRIWAYIRAIEPRRYVVVDEERGLVFGLFMFNHPGTVKTTDIPGIGTVAMPPVTLRPFSVEVAELFKIRSRRIREIEGVELTLPYLQKDGWEPCASSCASR